MKTIQLKDSSRARILIRAANWVGDAIMTTPVIRAVRKNYPQAHVTVLAKPWVIPVYENNPFVDEIMVYDNQGRHKFGLGTLRLASDIRQKGFDLAVLMQNAFEAAFLAFMAGIPERLGYNTDFRNLLLNPGIAINPDLKKKHLIDYYVGILKGAGLETDGRAMDLFVDQSDRDKAHDMLKEEGLADGRPLIGINPGATGGTAKRWFPERYAELAARLADFFNTRVIIFGGPADHGLGEEIREVSGRACSNMAGKTSLSQAFALIGRLDLFVTNDSGLMHAAAALDTPQVALVGSTDHIATAPSSRNAVMVRKEVGCNPCLKDECPTDHRCMDQLSVDMVMAACRKILNKKEGPPV